MILCGTYHIVVHYQDHDHPSVWGLKCHCGGLDWLETTLSVTILIGIFVQKGVRGELGNCWHGDYI